MYLNSNATIMAIREVQVLINLRGNLHLPTFLGVSIEDKNKILLVMDLYSVNGQVYDLSTALFKSNTLSLSQGELHCVLFKIADALQNVHFSGYLHNDVKMDNIILYRSQNMCQVEPILIDFNKACKIRGSVKKKLTVDCPTFSEHR